MFYIIVEPNELLAMEEPWSEGWEHDLEKYIAALAKKQARPICFRMGSRNYVELSSAQILRSGGLAAIVRSCNQPFLSYLAISTRN